MQLIVWDPFMQLDKDVQPVGMKTESISSIALNHLRLLISNGSWIIVLREVLSCADAVVVYLRSSLFLSSFICIAFGGACAGHHIMGRSTGAIIAGSTWVGGLATLMEKKSRRMELALYVLSRYVGFDSKSSNHDRSSDEALRHPSHRIPVKAVHFCWQAMLEQIAHQQPH